MGYLSKSFKARKEDALTLREAISKEFSPLIDLYALKFRPKDALSDALDTLRHTKSLSEASRSAKRVAKLNKLLKPRHLDELRYLARHGDWVTRNGAAQTLALIPDSKSKELFIFLLHTKDPGLVDSAVLGLGNLKDTIGKDCRKALRALLRNEDEGVVAAGIRALAALGDTAAVRWPLFHVSEEENLRKRRRVVEAVGESLGLFAQKDAHHAQSVMKIIDNFRGGPTYSFLKTRNSLMYEVIEGHFHEAEKLANATLRRSERTRLHLHLLSRQESK